jgi:hypothetical protein
MRTLYHENFLTELDNCTGIMEVTAHRKYRSFIIKIKFKRQYSFEVIDMLRSSTPLCYVLLAMFVYALFQGTGDRRHTLASAFEIKNWYQSYRCRSTATAIYQLKLSKPFPGSDVIVDHDRGQYCVDHFGSCTIAEMEALKNGTSFFMVLLLRLAKSYFVA